MDSRIIEALKEELEVKNFLIQGLRNELEVKNLLIEAQERLINQLEKQ